MSAKTKRPEYVPPKYSLRKMWRWLEVRDAGHVARPEERQPYGYGDTRVFDDFPSEEEAFSALRKKVEEEGQNFNELILVPVFITTIDYS